MAHMTLTPDIANAAGWDAGNASMRKAGRKRWNRDDWNVAAATTARLMAYLYPPDVAVLILENGGCDPATHPATAEFVKSRA